MYIHIYRSYSEIIITLIIIVVVIIIIIIIIVARRHVQLPRSWARRMARLQRLATNIDDVRRCSILILKLW